LFFVGTPWRFIVHVHSEKYHPKSYKVMTSSMHSMHSNHHIKGKKEGGEVPYTSPFEVLRSRDEDGIPNLECIHD